MFSEDQKFWILAHVSRGLGFLDLSSCVQRTKGFLGFWLMFSEVQKFWILAQVFRDVGFLNLGSCIQKTKGFFFWALVHVFRGQTVPDPGSCF